MRAGIAPQPRYAVGPYRVSTAEQGQSGLGLEAQQASVRAFAEEHGWTLIAEFSDIASGKDDTRPGFQAALTRCLQLGAIDLLLARTPVRPRRPAERRLSEPRTGWCSRSRRCGRPVS